MIDLLRELIREEIKKLIQDDALFRRGENPGILSRKDDPGIESDFDVHGDECPSCGEVICVCPPPRNISAAQRADEI